MGYKGTLTTLTALTDAVCIYIFLRQGRGEERDRTLTTLTEPAVAS